MSRSNCITRQQVLAAIVEAGVAGTTPKALIERFDCADQVIYNHVLSLTKQNPPAIFKPEKGRLVAIHFNGQVPPRKVVVTAAGKSMHATREAVLAFMEGKPSMTPATIADGIGCHEESTRAVLAGLYAGLKIDRAHDADLDDYRYIIGTPATVTQAAPLACGEKTAETETQPALKSADETQACVQETQAVEPEVILPGGELALVGSPIAAELSAALAEATQAEMTKPGPVADRRMPAIIPIEHEEDFEIGIFSDSTMTLVWEDGINAATIEFCPEAVKKLRRFLGLFAEAV